MRQEGKGGVVIYRLESRDKEREREREWEMLGKFQVNLSIVPEKYTKVQNYTLCVYPYQECRVLAYVLHMCLCAFHFSRLETPRLEKIGYVARDRLI